ncbi:unnamed protein product, partial [Ectocarpus sp. 4 AP-2014]
WVVAHLRHQSSTVACLKKNVVHLVRRTHCKGLTMSAITSCSARNEFVPSTGTDQWSMTLDWYSHSDKSRKQGTIGALASGFAGGLLFDLHSETMTKCNSPFGSCARPSMLQPQPCRTSVVQPLQQFYLPLGSYSTWSRRPCSHSARFGRPCPVGTGRVRF